MGGGLSSKLENSIQTCLNYNIVSTPNTAKSEIQSDAKIRDLLFVVNFLEKVPYFSISYKINFYSDRCYFC